MLRIVRRFTVVMISSVVRGAPGPRAQLPLELTRVSTLREQTDGYRLFDVTERESSGGALVGLTAGGLR
jgi:hypothetical protein